MDLRSSVINALRLAIVSLLLSSARGRTFSEFSQPSQCGDPGAPSDGYRLGGVHAPFAVGARVSYGCRVGYRLSGEWRLHCLQDDTDGGTVARWDGRAPECIPIRPPWRRGRPMFHSILKRTTATIGCTDFGDPRNGNRTLLKSGSIVTFGCDCGFELDGASSLECRQREWNGTWPRCIPVPGRAMCGDPGNIFPLFGRRFVEGTIEGSRVNYSCTSRMVLRGDAVRECLPNGQWSGTLPTCDPVNCMSPERPANGDFVHSHFGYGTTVVYSCHDGHVLEGEREVKCQEDGTWSAGPPICRAVSCPALPLPLHGTVSHPSPSPYLSEARYMCDTGYGLVGGETRVCSANGAWSGEEPTCEPGRCDELQRPEGGKISVDGYDVGANASYSCFPGYHHIGVTERVCQASGRWTDCAPRCELSTCRSNISVPANIHYSQTNGNCVFSVTTHWCNEGYALLGSRQRVCQPMGIWSGKIPGCFPIICPPLTRPKNGNYTLTAWRCYRSEAVYTCNEGYVLYGGDMIRTCQESNMWSGIEPCCIRERTECAPLPNITDGHVEVEGHYSEAVATYVCDEGFMLVGDSQRECSDTGVWSNSEPTCVLLTPVMCGELSRPANGDVNVSTREVGSVAEYSCGAGYLLSRDGTRICLDTGMWSGNAPTCTLIDCGTLVAPDNGNVTVGMTTVGGVASYKCDRLYRLVGPESRQCQSNGLWTGEAPVCEAIRCEALSPPANGAVDTSGNSSIGTIANYTCELSYRLVGMESRRCQENGMWTGETPTCEVILTCSLLEDPEFGRVVYEREDRMVGSSASYRCEAGYTLIGGESERVCLENQTWSSVAATCELLECPTLDDPRNGMVAVVNNTPGGVAFYLCNAGFMPEGETSRECERVGEREVQWSGDAPTCENIECPLLENPANGKVTTLPPYFVNITAVYICDAGFELQNGSIRRVCMPDGSWSGSAPLCVLSRISCPANLDVPDFGSVEIMGDGTLRSMAIYSCDLGYELVGERKRVCELDGLVGEWSGEAPTCRAVMCPPLDEPVDGFLRVTGLTVGAVTLVFCDTGFDANGPVRRQCLPTGMWDGNETLCDPRITTVSCGRLEDPDNGLVDLSDTVPGSIATYSCSLGYVLVNGRRERRCQDNGTWDGNEPSCNVVDCGPLSDPTNGMVVVEDTDLGATATYTCARGHMLVGLTDSIRFCTLAGTWTEMDPTCERVDCGSLSPPINGVVDQLLGTRFMDETVYTCLEGYILIPPESQTRTCTENGMWSGTDPTCELRASIIDCGSLPPLANGFISLLNSSTREGSLSEYSCRQGYMLVGGALRECRRNGQWSGEPPTCVERQCPQLRDPQNGDVFLSGTTVGSRGTYICDSGFELVGLVRRICQSNGEWTGDDTQCLRRDDVMCPPLTPPTNGSIDSEDGRSVGSMATYSCGEGFVLIGPEQRSCQSNGAWSEPEPTCERMECPDPGVPTNGRRLRESFQVGMSVLFLCDDGFDPVGMETLTCLEDGTWSHDTPTCVESPTLGSRRSRRGPCSGTGAEMLSGVGVRCMCVAGQLESCCRYRQEWSQLTPEQRMRYIAAMTTASSDPQFRPIYVSIMQLYLEAFGSVVLNDDPEISQFFPWHRYYLHLYEDLLRVIDRSVTIPYWDWTVHSEKPYDSDVFDPILGFGGSSDNVTLCVTSGPFQQREFAMTPQTGGGCIRRMYGDFPFLNRQLLSRILSLPASSFNDFHSTLQLFFHFPIRCSIGGTMCRNFASEDPVYLLLLTQLDRLLALWQSSDEERALVRYTHDTSPLVHTLEGSGTLKVSDYSSNEQLPYGASVCYSDAPALTLSPDIEPEI